MNKLQDIESDINILRDYLHKSIDREVNLTSKEIVTISQELDEVLNQYYEVLRASQI